MSEFMFAGGDNFNVFGDLCLALLSAVCGGHYAHTTSLKQTIQYRYLYRIQYTEKLLEYVKYTTKRRVFYFPKYRLGVINQVVKKCISNKRNGG